MVPDLLANPAAAGSSLEGLDAGLIVDLDRHGMAGQKARLHEGTAVHDAQDRTTEEDPTFLVLDGVVEPLLLRKPTQGQPAVLVTDQQRDLLAPLDQIAMTQEVERPAGRQDFVPHMGLVHLGSEHDDLGVRLSVRRARDGPIGPADPEQRALIGRQLRVVQTQRVAPDENIEIVAVERQIEPALGLGIVDDRAGVAVHGIELVRIQVREEPVVLGPVEVLEHLAELPFSGIEGRGDQVLPGDDALEVVGDAPLRIELGAPVHPRPLQVTPCGHLSDLAVGEGHEEDLCLRHLHLALDGTRAAIRIDHLNQEPAPASGQPGGEAEPAVRPHGHGLVVHLDAIARIRRARDDQDWTLQRASGRWQLHGQIGDRVDDHP